jgi:cell wall-associated NlpC family hydrolase
MQPDTVIKSAEAWLGFTTAGLNGRTPFGEKSGYDVNWAGAFIDTIFHDAGMRIPSCVYSSSGLAEFIKQGRVKDKPQPGDIVFFAFPTGDSFGVSHVGLVADTSRYKTDGLVGTIEAQVNSGLPKSDPHLRGVFRRIRSQHEIIAFARPDFKKKAQPAVNKSETGLTLISIRPGRRNKSIGLVQVALMKVTGSLGKITVDMFDGQTQHAYARWQRQIGYANDRATGIPDAISLQLLGEITGVFKLDA